MRLWADIYSAAGARLGGGPVSLRSASVTRVLDGIGSVSVTASGTDARARSLLAAENHVRIHYQPTDSVTGRELGRGVLRRIAASGTPGDWSVSADGPDDLDALTRISTKLGRMYRTQAVADIAADLVGLVTDWSVSGSGGLMTDARYDGVNVFKALASLVEHQGIHLRAGSSAKTLEIGAFGTAAGLRLVNAVQATPEMDSSDGVALIESIATEQNSEAVCNRLYPIGAGIGEAWLTLEKCTRTTPYTIGSATINGITQWYIEDSASVAANGLIEKVGKFSDIAPLSNSEADQVNAANALYDIAAAWLQRYAVRQDVYRVTVRKVRQLVRPGDQVRVVYNGVVVRDGLVVNFLDIDGDFWVAEVVERVGVEGAAMDLTLSSVDRHAHTGARVVIGALEELQIDGVSVKPYLNRAFYVYDRLIDPFHPAVGIVSLSNATQRLNRCVVKVKTRAFVSTVTPTLTNSLHRHTIMQSSTGVGPYHLRNVTMYDQASNAAFNALIPVSIESANLHAQTGTETNPEYLTLSFGLTSDSQTPAGIRVFVNGVDRTVALGGPWLPSGGAGSFEVNVTDYIVQSPPLQQDHEITLECTSGQGEVEMTIEVYETIQSIQVP